MARPSKKTVSHGVESWDSAINDNFSLIFDTPVPISVYSSASAFPSAAAYEDCLAVAQDTDQVYISDGSQWKLVGGASTFLALADTPSSYSGQAGKVLKVNSSEDGLEFADMTGGEDVSRDFYSDFDTDEKDMGMTWHNGLKIYSKVIDLGALPNAASASTLKSVAHNISGLTEIVRLWGWAKHSDGRVVPLPYVQKAGASNGQEVLLSANNTYIYLRGNGADFSSFSGKVVIWYTKSATGDSDANFMNLSTDEQRTGMNWVDGRPIYCKVLKDLAGSNGSEVSVAHGISNFKQLVFMDAYFGDQGNNAWKGPMNGVVDNAGTAHRMGYSRIDGTNLYYFAEGVNWSSRSDGHAILYYTKSDDEVPSPEPEFGRDFQLNQSVDTKSRWTDGKRIFKRVIDLGSLPNSSADAIHLALEDVSEILWQTGYSYNSTDSSYYAHPYFYSQDRPAAYAIEPERNSMARRTWYNDSNLHEFAVIYFTKNDPDAAKEISADLTVYVDGTNGTSSGDGSVLAPFASLQQALTWLNQYRIKDGITVTISVASGTYTCSTLQFYHQNLSQVEILGDTTARTGYAITAVSTSNKQFTIAGNHTSDFPAGAFLKVYGSTLNDGVFTVSSSTYSGGNTIITVNETIHDGTADGSLKSYNFNVTLDFSGSAQDGLIFKAITVKKFDGFIIKGSGQTNGKVGLQAHQHSSIISGGNILIHDFDCGAYIYDHADWRAGDIVIAKCGGDDCLKVRQSSFAIFDDYAAFCRASDSGRGVHSEDNSEIVMPKGISSDNDGDGAFISGQSLVKAVEGDFNWNGDNGVKIAYGPVAQVASAFTAHNVTIRHNTSDGLFLWNSARAVIDGGTVSDNGGNGLKVTDGSYAFATNTTIQNNTGTGMYAWGCSGIASNGANVTGNGTNFNPSQDTISNKNSMIYT